MSRIQRFEGTKSGVKNLEVSASKNREPYKDLNDVNRFFEKQICAILEEEIKKRGIKKKDLAGELGVSSRTISNCFNDFEKVGFIIICKLVSYFDLIIFVITKEEQERILKRRILILILIVLA